MQNYYNLFDSMSLSSLNDSDIDENIQLQLESDENN